MTTEQDNPSCEVRQCDEDHYDPDADWVVSCEAPNYVWGNSYEICSEQCGHGCYYELVLAPEADAEHQAEMADPRYRIRSAVVDILQELFADDLESVHDPRYFAADAAAGAAMGVLDTIRVWREIREQFK